MYEEKSLLEKLSDNNYYYDNYYENILFFTRNHFYCLYLRLFLSRKYDFAIYHQLVT